MSDLQRYISNICQHFIFILLIGLMLFIPASHYLILAAGNYYNAIQNCIYVISLLLFITMIFGVVLGGLRFNAKFIPVLICLMTVLAILSTIRSINSNTSIWGTNGRFEGLFMLLSYYTIFLSSAILNDDKLRLNLIRIFLFIGVVHSLYGLCQRFDLFENIVIDRYASYHAISGVAGNPNFMGTYTVLLCGLASAFFYFSKTIKERIIYLICLILFLLTMILTDAMSALFGTCIMIIVFFVYLFLTRKQYSNYSEPFSSFKLLLVAMVLGIFGLFSLLLLTDNNYIEQIIVMFEDLKNLLTGGEITVESGARRFLVWKESLTLVPTYWLSGSGPDTFGEAYHAVFPVRDEFFNKAHNEYIQILITQGIPVLLCYLTLYFYTIKKSINEFKRMYLKKDLKFDYLYIGLFIAVIGYLFQAIFNISVIDVAPFFWMILGLLSGWAWNKSSRFV